jgi:hypothetical protein
LPLAADGNGGGGRRPPRTTAAAALLLAAAIEKQQQQQRDAVAGVAAHSEMSAALLNALLVGSNNINKNIIFLSFCNNLNNIKIFI